MTMLQYMLQYTEMNLHAVRLLSFIAELQISNSPTSPDNFIFTLEDSLKSRNHNPAMSSFRPSQI